VLVGRKKMIYRLHLQLVVNRGRLSRQGSPFPDKTIMIFFTEARRRETGVSTGPPIVTDTLLWVFRCVYRSGEKVFKPSSSVCSAVNKLISQKLSNSMSERRAPVEVLGIISYMVLRFNWPLAHLQPFTTTSLLSLIVDPFGSVLATKTSLLAMSNVGTVRHVPKETRYNLFVPMEAALD